MPKENKTIELNDKELEKAAGGDEAIAFFEKDLSFTFQGVTYHVCQDTVVYSMDQDVRVYKNVNTFEDSVSFCAGLIMQCC